MILLKKIKINTQINPKCSRDLSTFSASPITLNSVKMVLNASLRISVCARVFLLAHRGLWKVKVYNTILTVKSFLVSIFATLNEKGSFDGLVSGTGICWCVEYCLFSFNRYEGWTTQKKNLKSKIKRLCFENNAHLIDGIL